MTKNHHHPETASKARQYFFVPHRAPFLELRTTLDSTLPYAEHVHSAFSLGLILQGKTLFTLEGTQHLAEEGDIVVIAQGSAHSCNPIDGPRAYHMLLMDVAWLQEYMADGLAACPPLIRDATLLPRAVAVMDAIRADQQNAVALLTDLLLELRTRHGHSATGGQTRSPLMPALNHAEEAIDGADAAPSVFTLARVAGMRRESFSRAMRRSTGLPPSRYMHCLRLEKARYMLRQGKSIIEAALATGYTDQSHFHRVFVKFCAITPGRYLSGMSHSYKK